jgi:putative restriction endonuclease
MEREISTRQAAFDFLEGEVMARGEVLPWQVLTTGFSYQGTTVPLLGAAGIWKPSATSLPISITTAPRSPGRPAPYDDAVGSDGLLEYHYEGDDPSHWRNQALRAVFENRLPLIYFYGVEKGHYRPFWPAFIERDEPHARRVFVELHDAAETRLGYTLGSADGDQLDRAYARQLTLRRLHQAAFRDRVLRAYGQCCAVCRLKHRQLLDAAHILSDRRPGGDPVVPNGLALCKIHHAAFDANILGIRPDLVLEIRPDILSEVDGPMLQHGIKAVHGTTILTPRRTSDRPSRERLELRYEEFRAAS